MPVPYLKSRYKRINSEGIINYTYSEHSSYRVLTNSNYDSIISLEMNTPNFNYEGKYLEALQSIKDRSKFHKEFFDVKNASGMFNPRLIASGMLHTNIDLSDVLNRKIIVLELVY